DPAAARTLVDRLDEAHPGLVAEIAADARVRDGVVALAAASRSLSSAVVADPSLLDPLRDGTAFVVERDVDGYRGSWNASTRHAALGVRRWRRGELVAMGAGARLGVAALPAVGRELAALAEVCLGAALELTEPAVPMAVIGMGKLGGRELNYASDVDVLF